MLRICPECKSNLGPTDYYFCTNCGIELPEEFVKRDYSFRNVTLMGDIPKQKFSFKSTISGVKSKVNEIPGRGAILISFIAVFLLIGALTYFRHTNKPQGLQLNPETEVVPSTANVPSGVFGEKIIAEYVPFEADVYIETKDFNVLAELFSEFDKGYADLIQDLEKFVEPHMGFFLTLVEEKPVMTVIVFPKKEEWKIDDINLEGYDWVIAENVDGALVLSSSVEIVSSAEYAKSGLTKNLTHNPFYAKNSKKTVTEGEILIAAITPEGKLLLEYVMETTESDEIKQVLTKFKNSQSDFVII